MLVLTPPTYYSLIAPFAARALVSILLLALELELERLYSDEVLVSKKVVKEAVEEAEDATYIVYTDATREKFI